MAVKAKIVGTSGQISIGKQYASQQVLIEDIEPGEWRIQTAITIPKSQASVHTRYTQAEVDRAIKWETNLAGRTAFDLRSPNARSCCAKAITCDFWRYQTITIRPTRGEARAVR